MNFDGLPTLILLCAVMAGASFAVGILPLSLALSPRQLRLITALGTGVLVGTSLVVIIPEGIEVLYEAGGAGHSHAVRAVRMMPRSVTVEDRHFVPILDDIWQWSTSALPSDTDLDDGECADLWLQKRRETTSENPNVREEDETLNLGGRPLESDTDEDHEHGDFNPHAWVGVSLIAGFILMYVIDSIPKHASTASQPQRFAISLNQFSLTRTRTSSVTDPPATSTSAQGSTSRPSSTTIGLVIHACADGIALGASSTTTSRLSFLIFIALMIHKAPAAFGLTSVLLKQGLSKRAVKAHLIVFAMAAPVGALLTWGAAHVLGYSTSAISSSTDTEFATGVLLIFSGGTFLYVAMHTMQEDNAHDGDTANGHMNGYAGVPMSEMDDMYGSGTPTPQKSASGGFVETLVCVVGMLLPLLTQFGHVH